MYIFRHKTKQRKYTITVLVILIIQIIVAMLLLSGCGAQNAEEDMTVEQKGATEVTYNMQMKIGDIPVSVDWEDNDAVRALAELTAGDWHEYKLSMYGGFEQVGPLGSDLPAEDKQTTTEAGDIVLYQGNQIVVFYGSNSWAYTRLGHISDKNADELSELLGNGDVTISIRTEYSE